MGASVVGRLKLAMRGVALTESVANCEDKKQLLLLNDKLGMCKVTLDLSISTFELLRTNLLN